MNDDILDTQIRVIGGGRKPDNKPTGKPTDNIKNKLIGVAIGIIAAVAIIVLILISNKNNTPEEEVGVFESEQVMPAKVHPLQDWVQAHINANVRGTALKDTVVNDIPLLIELPIGAKPHLAVGYDCLKDTASYILLTQAADVRADNKKIVGAFVLQGEPLSWSLGKKGFCAIIDDELTVGVAENSPLFEEAINHGGDFFRQYPLVDNGQLVENELKAKSVRRALCELEGATALVQTDTPESLHDFAQALVDLGVTNAIYLVGGGALHFSRTEDGIGTAYGLWNQRPYKNASFIIWK